MGGDYTRFTFDPIKGLSGVHKQQGRVSLEADFNEFEEILDRQSRAEMYDIVGQAVVPETTPNGFLITIGGGGKLAIGNGRAYVDGILVDCFGDVSNPMATVRDDRLGGVRGLPTVDIDKQPFFYPALPTALFANSLVYLDVWQREVTPFEDLGLLDPALNGRDTATRVQTAWQVKVADGGTGTCDTPDWSTINQPSTGRLTATATPTAPAPGPCVINPVGGYTGLGNRLYRIEIHDAGTLGGGATFKWSRDNASLAAHVLAIVAGAVAGQSVITVNSTGRDEWMRFEHGDHLELLDDDVEFAMRDSGKSGRMAKIVSVNHATSEITIDQDYSLPAVQLARHPRIRRWDNAAAAEPLTRPATGTTVIEEGISVTFVGAVADTFHAGDFWVFAARTADGSIDTVVNAPPRGILHHFAQLAFVTAGPPPTRTSDCRVFWPAPHEGCCTAVVRPGENIQAAIDLVERKGGGCVCLKMGVHTIGKPLQITQSNITMHGEVPWVTVRSLGATVTMIEIGDPKLENLLENVSVLALSLQPRIRDKVEKLGGAIIQIAGVTGGRIADSSLSVRNVEQGSQPVATGIRLNDCHDYAIESNVFSDLTAGIAGIACGAVRVTENTLSGTLSPEAREPVSTGVMGIVFTGDQEGGPFGIAVERNDLRDFRRGIQLGDLSSNIVGGFVGGHNVVGGLREAVFDPNAAIAGTVHGGTAHGGTLSGGALSGGTISGSPSSGGGILGQGPTAGPQKVDTIHVNAGCRIEGNVIRRRGALFDRLAAGLKAFAIYARVARCEIRENAVQISALSDSGILAVAGNLLIERNEVRSFVVVPDGTTRLVLPNGVAVHAEPDFLGCTVRTNLFTGLQQAVVVSGQFGVTGGTGGPVFVGKGDGSTPTWSRADVLENRVFVDPKSQAAIITAAQSAVLAEKGALTGGTGSLLDALPALLDSLTPFASILVGGVSHARIATNEVTGGFAAIFIVGGDGISVAENRINQATIGVVAGELELSEVVDNVIQRASSTGVFLMGGEQCVIARNALARCDTGILSLASSGTRVQDNDVSLGYTGISFMFERDGEAIGNRVSQASEFGIQAELAIHRLTLTDNHVLRCGYPKEAGVVETAAIAVFTVLGLVTIAGCHVVDTGESPAPNASPFVGRRYGIVVSDAGSVQISGCVVTSRPLSPYVNPNPGSRAICVISTVPQRIIDMAPDNSFIIANSPPFVDVSDNLAEQPAKTLVQLGFFGELIFASNRCTNLTELGVPTVQLACTSVVATGNRVRSEYKQSPSLRVAAPQALSAVGNMCSGGSIVLVPAGVITPAPYTSFNSDL